MTAVIVRKHDPKRNKQKLAIRKKRVHGPNGKLIMLPTLDAEAPDFGLRLEAVFRANVAKALKRKALKKRTVKTETVRHIPRRAAGQG